MSFEKLGYALEGTFFVAVFLVKHERGGKMFCPRLRCKIIYHFEMKCKKLFDCFETVCLVSCELYVTQK